MVASTIGRIGNSLLVILTALAGSQAALAQSNWLDKAKEAVGGLGKTLPTGEALSSEDIAAGLREALKIGSQRVVGQLGSRDGFNGDPEIHIPLPGALQDVQSVLQRVGMAGLADDLELKLNRGAEAAAPEAKALFLDAISEMTLDDAGRIYNGPKDAATRYFQGKMSPPLARRMAPIVEKSLAEVGAVKSYDAMIDQYKAIPFVPDVKSDLTGYVVEQAMDGLFHYIAKEEAAIRENPAARTTELLQKVFGN
jgi:hypothetical protein